MVKNCQNGQKISKLPKMIKMVQNGSKWSQMVLQLEVGLLVSIYLCLYQHCSIEIHYLHNGLACTMYRQHIAMDWHWVQWIGLYKQRTAMDWLVQATHCNGLFTMDWHLERIFQLFAAIFQGLATSGHIFGGLAKSGIYFGAWPLAGIYFNVYNTGFLLFVARQLC